jgi:hypothetical protein
MAKAKVGSKEWAAENAELFKQGDRRCTKCREVKGLDNGFYRDKSGREGYASYCKACDMKVQGQVGEGEQVPLPRSPYGRAETR